MIDSDDTVGACVTGGPRALPLLCSTVVTLGVCACARPTSDLVRPTPAAPPTVASWSGITPEAGCTATSTRVAGATDEDGAVSWDVVVPQLAGCDTTGGTVFNDAMLGALDVLLAQVVAEPGRPTAVVGADSVLTRVTEVSAAGVVRVVVGPGEPTSTALVEGVVVDRATARSIPTEELFPDAEAATARLRDVLPAVVAMIPEVVGVDPTDPGLLPDGASGTTWQPAELGLTLLYGDGVDRKSTRLNSSHPV